jgi:pimeloyl-ACP methyl ester carboxylesterase
MGAISMTVNDIREEIKAFWHEIRYYFWFGLAAILLVWSSFYFSPARFATEEPYKGVRLQHGVIYASARHWNYRIRDMWKLPKLQWLHDHGDHIELVTEPPTAEELNQEGDVIILIHGYRTLDTNVATYFAELIDYLKTSNNHAPIIVYNWFSIAYSWEDRTDEDKKAVVWVGSTPQTPSHLGWEQNHYNMDKSKATLIGAPMLIQLIKTIVPRTASKKVKIVAHSMGSRVALEALRRENEIGHSIGALILLAPALGYGELEDAEVAAGIKYIGNVHVFYSANDVVLAKYATYAEWGRQLGSHGPRNPKSSPKNIEFHDVTKLYGEGLHVHSYYLTKSGAEGASLARLLH